MQVDWKLGILRLETLRLPNEFYFIKKKNWIINLQFATVDSFLVLFFAFYYHLSSPWKWRLLFFQFAAKKQQRRRDLLESHCKLHSFWCFYFLQNSEHNASVERLWRTWKMHPFFNANYWRILHLLIVGKNQLHCKDNLHNQLLIENL